MLKKSVEKMKRNPSIILTVALLALVAVSAAGQVQQGRVRTIGRPGKPGVPLNGVTVRWRGVINKVLTHADGTFSVVMPGKNNGDPIALQSVFKSGYELQDKGIIGRQQVFSTTVPIVITMVSTAQLQADKERIEKNAYDVAYRNYNKKVSQLEAQLNEKQITLDKYRQELKALQEKFEAYQSLIGDMAERYARTDYDELDSIDYQINVCIENGELEKADSLIHTVFDPETVLERNRAAKEEIRQRMEFAQSVIDKANADKEAIKRDLEYAGRVVALSDNLVEEYLAQGEKVRAIDCLEKSLEILIILHGEDSKPVKAARERIKSLKST